jgi:predicted Zn-dependent protease
MVDNLSLSVDGGAGDIDDLVARTDEGLLLTSLWYLREVDPQTQLLTGLTRDGVFVVRGGEVVGVASNFRFNDSPIDVLRRVQDAGATTPTFSREWGEYFARVAMPPLRVADFHLSTLSDAL